MTPKLKVLRVIFDGEMRPSEIPALRGAIADKVGQASVLFHNHIESGFRYRYPLIQYKCIRNHPALICIGEGVDEIHHFFSQKDWSVEISGRKLPMKIEHLDMNQFSMQVWDREFSYRIQSWIALNQETYREFQQITEKTQQIPFLEKKLTGNILSMAKGIGWFIEKPIKTRITDLADPYPLKVKGLYVTGFRALFRTNVFLPDGIGLGKHVSLGFGTVQQVKNDRAEKTTITETTEEV
ncbi:MAG: CRISPR-associated endonuclease Cas6 [Bacteroidia bacterium]|nr:CRISPR-associated endonuclease Cas6 [Bacteroidia bacterium]